MLMIMFSTASEAIECGFFSILTIFVAFCKNNRPVTTIEREIKPPKTEIVTKSKNVMVASVKCLEVRNDYERRDSKLMEMYYKLPTFLLDNI